MKKFIAASLLFAGIGHAEVFKCTFTEPFMSSTYIMAHSMLVYKDTSGNETVVKNVLFQIKSEGVFELVGKNGDVLQTLNLNHQGSDGMSDRLYPFEVKDTNELTKRGQGGCESSQIK